MLHLVLRIMLSRWLLAALVAGGIAAALWTETGRVWASEIINAIHHGFLSVYVDGASFVAGCI